LIKLRKGLIEILQTIKKEENEEANKQTGKERNVMSAMQCKAK